MWIIDINKDVITRRNTISWDQELNVNFWYIFVGWPSNSIVHIIDFLNSGFTYQKFNSYQ